MADAQTLLTEGHCFACFGASTAQIIKLALLSRILKSNDPAADTSPEALLAYAKCFHCITDASQVALMDLALLDQIEHAVEGGGGGGNGNCPENLSGEGDPTGDVTPDFVGQFYTDNATDNLYKATGLTDADWELIETDGGECPPQMVEWEPENENAWEFLGIFSWNYEWDGSITSLTFNHTVIGEGLDVSGMDGVETVDCPNLTQIGGDGINIMDNEDLSLIDFPLLETVGNNMTIRTSDSLETINAPELVNAQWLRIDNNPSLTALSFPKLEATSQVFDAKSNALTSVSLPLLASVGGAFRFDGNALTEASVNHILARAVAFSPAWGAGNIINLEGGTNAAPSGQGVTDMNTLIAAGVTVNVNE